MAAGVWHNAGMDAASRRTFLLPDAAPLSYLDLGSGPAMLLIHGFPGTARRHLGDLIDRYAPSYRVIAPDLRGYGASSPPPRQLSPDFYRRDAADLARLLDHLAVGPAILLGFSDGAESALLLAALRPDLARAVVAWGVSGVISETHLAAVQEWLPVQDWGPERAAWRAQIIADHGEAQLRPLIEGWVQAAAAIVAAGGNICLAEAARIRCPALLINGEGEVGNLPEDVQRLAAAIPNARLRFAAGAGHAVHWQHPEWFGAQVDAFLAEIGAASQPSSSTTGS